MIKQIVGAIFLIIFISFLANKLYNALKDVEYGSLIMYICVLVVIVIVLGVGKQLRGY